jgi:hypothetical protein
MGAMRGYEDMIKTKKEHDIEIKWDTMHDLNNALADVM